MKRGQLILHILVGILLIIAIAIGFYPQIILTLKPLKSCTNNFDCQMNYVCSYKNVCGPPDRYGGSHCTFTNGDRFCLNST